MIGKAIAHITWRTRWRERVCVCVKGRKADSISKYSKSVICILFGNQNSLRKYEIDAPETRLRIEPQVSDDARHPMRNWHRGAREVKVRQLFVYICLRVGQCVTGLIYIRCEECCSFPNLSRII